MDFFRILKYRIFVLYTEFKITLVVMWYKTNIWQTQIVQAIFFIIRVQWYDNKNQIYMLIDVNNIQIIYVNKNKMGISIIHVIIDKNNT